METIRRCLCEMGFVMHQIPGLPIFIVYQVSDPFGIDEESDV